MEFKNEEYHSAPPGTITWASGGTPPAMAPFTEPSGHAFIAAEPPARGLSSAHHGGNGGLNGHGGHGGHHTFAAPPSPAHSFAAHPGTFPADEGGGGDVGRAAINGAPPGGDDSTSSAKQQQPQVPSCSLQSAIFLFFFLNTRFFNIYCFI